MTCEGAPKCDWRVLNSRLVKSAEASARPATCDACFSRLVHSSCVFICSSPSNFVAGGGSKGLCDLNPHRQRHVLSRRLLGISRDESPRIGRVCLIFFRKGIVAHRSQTTAGML